MCIDRDALRSRLAVLACVAGLGAHATPAHADGQSIDIELMHVVASENAVPGVDAPMVARPGRWRLGMAGQYTEDPLILYVQGNDAGIVVQHRSTGWAVVDFGINERAAVRLSLPLVWQGSSQVAVLDGDGTGLGDLSGAFRVGILDRHIVGGRVGESLGARIDVTAPTGRKDAWTGEEGLRTGAAILNRAELGRVAWLVDVGATIRKPVDTEADFVLGTELALNTAIQVEAMTQRVWVFGGVLDRAGTSELFQGGAENSLEALAGIQVKPIFPLRLDLAWGRGLTEGYGTSTQRYFAALTWSPSPRPPDEIPAVTITEVVEPEITIPDDTPTWEAMEQEWKEGELARIEGEQIVIRDPIQFEFATNKILPVSIPTLQYVSSLLRDNDRIEHVVVEGHASDEGDFAYNYGLSMTRATAVWEQLVLAGTHPERLSVRGMGEVVPKVAGDEESQLAENRRVEFHIVRQLDALELAPERAEDIRLPWSGVEATVSTPPPGQDVNAAQPTGPKRVVDPDELPEDGFDFEDDEDDDQ